MCDSRFAILKTLKRRRCTVEDLSATLAISTTAVRQHLTILEGDSLVKSEAVKQGMGRPKYVYSLTQNAEDYFPKRYHVLAEALIEEIVEEGEDKLRRVVKNISSRLSSPYKREVTGKPIGERMALLERIFCENGGYVEVKEEKDGFRFMEYNCPISMLSQKYPILCDIDLNLIKSISGAEVVREKCISANDDYCLFKIKI